MSDKSSPSDRIEQLADRIVNYLESYPQATDTAAGVAGWWLRLDNNPDSIAQTKAALEILVAKGLINKFTSRSSEPVYRRRGSGTI